MALSGANVIVAATAVANPAEYIALVVVVIVGALGGESVGFALGRKRIVEAGLRSSEVRATAPPPRPHTSFSHRTLERPPRHSLG